jgi:hypothetical protein
MTQRNNAQAIMDEEVPDTTEEQNRIGALRVSERLRAA